MDGISSIKSIVRERAVRSELHILAALIISQPFPLLFCQ